METQKKFTFKTDDSIKDSQEWITQGRIKRKIISGSVETCPTHLIVFICPFFPSMEMSTNYLFFFPFVNVRSQ